MIVTREMGTVLPDTTMTSPVYLDVKNSPFKLYGFCEPFRRLPVDVAEATGGSITVSAGNSAGGRIRFKTNSDFIVVHGDHYYTEKNNHTMSFVTARGFDIYVTENGKQQFCGIFHGSQPDEKSYTESRLRFAGKMNEFTIYFPITTSFENVYIGLREGSEIEPADDYKYEKQIVFYGSSIVHGAVASRPSLVYTSVLSRRLDSNFINLGFGGAAKAERSIMEYIAGLDMSIFVYDYDHNAPTPEYLAQTHYAGYKTVREKHPDTPIIFASRSNYWTRNYIFETTTLEESEERRSIIEENYKRAVAEGDKNVYFVDGSKMYPEDMRGDCTVDGCHPNDIGCQYMADAFEKVIRPILEK